ncbi:Fic/DOC family N-terminal domain-containing protein [Anaerorhabdus sp.]|uniref:Fic/DOC family N-terminal domain-containing protein n=1 Tax=Anaerorhabdus sp. TaxID=1872524 RepID=UPI002B2177A2|nr:Fic/DOC family N-terminal domain-containing protein [Anaerorhabdus sp.]MEA4874287.1 Fic/DOC family N-terminal domain-containing protein [Anaerorhabdus sp.]
MGEAKESSEIENIITTYDKLLKKMVSNIHENVAKEVLQYRQGINMGFSILKEKGFISINSIIDIHHCIEANKGGIRKLSGTVIKNAITNEIVSSMENNTMQLKQKLSKLYSSNLVDFLYFEFYTKNEYLRQKIGCFRDMATKHLKMLEK